MNQKKQLQELERLRKIFPKDEYDFSQNLLDESYYGQILIKPQLSGKSIEVETRKIRLKQLPQIRLNFTLPNGYPNTHIPVFSFTEPWLSDLALGLMISNLETEARLELGKPMLRKCFDNLNSIFLNLLSTIHDDSGETCFLLPFKYLANTWNGMESAAAITAYNIQRNQMQLFQSLIPCGICAGKVRGSKSVKLDCGHSSCKDCFRKAFKMHMGKGILGGPFSCLQCEHLVTLEEAKQLKGVASSDLLLEYEKFLDQRSKIKGSRVCRCPKNNCSTFVFLSNQSDVAVCPSCHHQFCSKCLQEAHQGRPCRANTEELTQKVTGDDDLTTRLWRIAHETKTERRLKLVQYQTELVDRPNEEYRSHKLMVELNVRVCSDCGTLGYYPFEGYCHQVECPVCNAKILWSGAELN